MVSNILLHIATFLFTFSSLSLVRLLFKFISSLITYEKLKISTRELIFYGICLSYFITFIVEQI
jgi:hypothetical protein